MGVSSPHFCIFISRSQYQPVDRIENYWTPWLCCTFQQGPLQQVGPLHWKGSKETLEGRLQRLPGKLWTIHRKFPRNKPETNGCSLNQKKTHLFKGWHLVGCNDFIHPKRPVKVPGIRDLLLFILPFWPVFGGELIGFTKADGLSHGHKKKNIRKLTWKLKKSPPLEKGEDIYTNKPLLGGFNPFENYDILYIYIYSQNANLPHIGVENNKYLSCHLDVQ